MHPWFSLCIGLSTAGYDWNRNMSFSQGSGMQPKYVTLQSSTWIVADAGSDATG